MAVGSSKMAGGSQKVMKVGGKKRATPKANQVQKKNKTARDFASAVNEDAIQEIVDLLRKTPTSVLPCLGALRSNFFEDTTDFVESNAWPATYMRMDQVPKYWLLQWCKDNLSGVIGGEALDLICSASRTGIRELVEFLTGIRMHGKLPRLCLIKQVLSLVLLHFLVAKKRLTQEWWSIVYDPETGCLSWWLKGGGVIDYEQVDGNKVAKLKHVSSGVEFDAGEDVNILANVNLSKNYSDWDCEYSKGKVSIKWVQQEETLAAVKEECSYEKFKEIAETLHAELEEKQEKLDKGSVVAKPVKVESKPKAKAKAGTKVAPPSSTPVVKVKGVVDAADAAGGGG